MSGSHFDDHELGGEGYINLSGETPDCPSPKPFPKSALSADFPQPYKTKNVGNDATSLPADFVVPDYEPTRVDQAPEDFSWARIYGRDPK